MATTRIARFLAKPDKHVWALPQAVEYVFFLIFFSLFAIIIMRGSLFTSRDRLLQMWFQKLHCGSV